MGVSKEQNLQDFSRQQMDILANISHSVRTPIHTIMGMTDLALQDVNDPIAVDNYLCKIKKAGSVLINQINELLELTRLENNETESRPELCTFETIKHFDTLNYEFAVRETKTFNVIEDVANFKSEIGILYLNDFNRKVLQKILKENDCEFYSLVKCSAYVYIWKNHPLAKQKSITFDELKDYPCLSFEQGENGSFYFAEEILSTNDYQRTIKATDRATMLNLMVGLNGYTLCSGIICEELNGSDYIAVPFEADEDNPNSSMEIGYITKKNAVLSDIGRVYIDEITSYLSKTAN